MASVSQPSMAGASSTRSSNGIPNVETPTAASSRPGVVALSRSRPTSIPRPKLACAPSAASLPTVVDARRFPARSQTAAAIFVPP